MSRITLRRRVGHVVAGLVALAITPGDSGAQDAPKSPVRPRTTY